MRMVMTILMQSYLHICEILQMRHNLLQEQFTHPSVPRLTWLVLASGVASTPEVGAPMGIIASFATTSMRSESGKTRKRRRRIQALLLPLHPPERWCIRRRRRLQHCRRQLQPPPSSPHWCIRCRPKRSQLRRRTRCRRRQSQLYHRRSQPLLSSRRWCIAIQCRRRQWLRCLRQWRLPRSSRRHMPCRRRCLQPTRSLRQRHWGHKDSRNTLRHHRSQPLPQGQRWPTSCQLLRLRRWCCSAASQHLHRRPCSAPRQQRSRRHR